MVSKNSSIPFSLLVCRVIDLGYRFVVFIPCSVGFPARCPWEAIGKIYRVTTSGDSAAELFIRWFTVLLWPAKFVPGGLWFNSSSLLVNRQLVCLLSVGILNLFRLFELSVSSALQSPYGEKDLYTPCTSPDANRLARLVEHRPTVREVASPKPRPEAHSGFLNNW